MKKTLLIVLLGSNLAWMFWLLHRSPPPLSPEPAPAVQSVAQPEEPRGTPAAVRLVSAATMPEPAPVPGPFHWGQLESPDYCEYIRRLRAVGCPEATVADIIKADVHALYNQRRTEARASAPVKFWQADYRLGTASASTTELDREEQAVLEKLLGRQHAAPPSEETAESGRLALPRELAVKQATLEEWAGGFRERFEEALIAIRSGGLGDNGFEHLARLGQERSAALDGILTVEEREEFELRNSATADELRSALEGVDVTEAEFRDLFRLRQLELEDLGSLAEADPMAINLAKRAYENETRRLLGEERYRAFKHAQGLGLAEVDTHPVEPQ